MIRRCIHLGTSYQQIEIRHRNVHVDFAGGTDSCRRAPCEFVRRRRLGQRNQLPGNMPPLAIVSLSDPLWRLGEQQGRAQQKPQQDYFHKACFHDAAPLIGLGHDNLDLRAPNKTALRRQHSTVRPLRGEERGIRIRAETKLNNIQGGGCHRSTQKAVVGRQMDRRNRAQPF